MLKRLSPCIYLDTLPYMEGETWIELGITINHRTRSAIRNIKKNNSLAKLLNRSTTSSKERTAQAYGVGALSKVRHL